MYIKKLLIENYGAIESIDYAFPFNVDGTPKPVILVGKNGVGKTLLLSNILNALIEFKRGYYRELKEVSDDNYYRVGSKSYIRAGSNHSYEHYIFENNAEYTNLMTVNYDQLKENFSYEKYININLTDEKLVNDGFFSKCNKPNVNVFDNNVFLYFPVERYYIPTWENKSNKQLMFITREQSFVGQSCENMIKYNIFSDIEQWILDVLIDQYLYESNTRIIENNNQLYPKTFYKGKNTNIVNEINRALSLIFINSKYISVRIGVSQKRNLYRTISIIGKLKDGSEEGFIPLFSNMSSGEMMIFGIVASILKEYDRVSDNTYTSFENISGIVLIDEIDSHLHSDLLKDVLPNLIKLFPKIQFIMSSHSPFFLLGMQEKFGDKCQFLNFPSGVIFDSIEYFDEISRCYSIIDESYDSVLKSLEETRVKLSRISKPLIITEGKTDWKHLKNALLRFKEQGKFIDVELEFLETETSMGDDKLEKLLNNLSIMPNAKLIIGIFDNDSSTGKKYEAVEDKGNNVFAVSIKDVQGYDCGISIELLYAEKDLKKYDENKRRIYLSDEFTEKSGRLKTDSKIICTNKTLKDAKNKKSIKIVDHDVYDENDVSIALSKEDFAKNIINRIPPFNDIDISGFENIYSSIKSIIDKYNLKT